MIDLKSIAKRPTKQTKVVAFHTDRETADWLYKHAEENQVSVSKMLDLLVKTYKEEKCK